MLRISRFVGFCSILAAFVVFVPSDVFGQKKDKKAAQKTTDYAATAEEYAKIRNLKEMSGRLAVVDGAGKTLTLRIEIPNYEPNPNYKGNANGNGGNGQNNPQNQMLRQYQDLMRQQQIAMTAKTPQQRQQALARVQMDMARLQQQQAQYMAKTGTNGNPNNQAFKLVPIKKDFELEVDDKVVVRKMFLGTEYDDTGNLKQYSDKEKVALRGTDRSKPGYEAKIDELQPTQEIKIYLTPPKAKKRDAKADEAEPEGSDRPTVNMIVMTTPIDVGMIEGANPKKKNKK